VSRKLILLVEDTADDEELILRALRKSGIDVEVVVARDGEEALEYLFASGQYLGRDSGCLPDMVLSDLKLPRIDGLELLKQIRADSLTRAVPVVIFSSSTQDDDLQRAYSNGANSFVRKPVNCHGFQEAVRPLGCYWLALNERPPSRSAVSFILAGVSLGPQP
jgi:two-component system response regulator